MSQFSKSAPKRASNSAVPARKPGSRSAGHRGFRPADDAPAPKKRWTTADRAQRAGTPAAGERKPFRGRDAAPRTNDGRPDWTPREKPAYKPRGERPTYGDRPAYADRTDRADRTARP